MPRNASGTYTLPTGNPVVTGTIIESTWANGTMADIASALTNSLARDGAGGMTAALRVVDGSVSVPGLGFANETGSGLYRSAAGDVGLAILGNQILRMRSTGLDVTGALSYTGTLTGGTGVINIGSGQIYKDASGNVGIGTSSPSDALTLASGNLRIQKGIPELRFRSAGDVKKWYIGANISDSIDGGLIIGTGDGVSGGTARIAIDSSGNVGIGTSSPAARLHLESTGNEINRSLRLAFDGTYYANIVQAGAAGLFYRTFGGTPHVWEQAGAEVMRIDPFGNVGIGTSSPGARLNVFGSDATGFVGIAAQNSNFNTGIAGIEFGSDPTYKKAAIGLVRSAANGVGSIVFFNDSNTDAANWSGGDEKMRIDPSGNLLVGTAIGNARIVAKGSTGTSDVFFAETTTGTGYVFKATGTFGNAAYFVVNGSQAGFISCTTTATNYASGSDYRLKEQIAPMTGALAKNELLNPVTFKWKTDGSDGQGFIAHELQAVFPDAVTGEKDAVDDDGKPVYQGVDTSFLVGHLVACVKELKAEVDALKAAAA